MPEIGVAFVGTGNVADLHEQAVRSIHGVKLVGICGASSQETERRAKQWNVRGYTSYEQMLDDPHVEVVFVLTPLEFHFEHASLAMRKGKHVIVEKPVAPDPAQIRELQRIADQQGVRCLPGHNYIYAPEIRRGKQLIERGDLGTICGIWVHFAIFQPEELTRTWPGALRQVGTHFYYLLLYLLGKPQRLYATKSCLHYKEIKQEDQFMVQLEMPGGAMGSLFCTFACDDQTADPWTFHVKVLGTNGGFSYTWRSAIFNRALGTLPVAIVPYEETFREMDDYLLTRCIRSSEEPPSSLASAASAAELIENTETSIQNGLPVCIDKTR
jgi:predicted dehydrogenase